MKSNIPTNAYATSKMVSPARIIRLATLLFTLSACATAAVAQDTITLARRGRSGSKVIGTIKEVSPTTITVETTGGPRQIPAKDVQRVAIAGEPSTLRRARTAFYSEQYDQVVQMLDAAAASEVSGNPLLAQELDFLRVAARAKLALTEGRDANEAIRDLLSFVKKHRRSFHFYEAVRLLGDLAMQVGKFDRAVVYYAQIGKAPWPSYQQESLLFQADAWRQAGKCDEAGPLYDRLLQQATQPSDPELARIARLARVGQATCWAETGRNSDAIDALEKLIADHDPADRDLFARAYLALGTAYRKAGRPLDAALAYLHVDLLFFQNRAAHAEALYYLTQLWDELQKPERALEARSLLKSRYPNSIWAARLG